jgi:hypothetical protein
MEFYTGKDYPRLCDRCKSGIDECAEEIEARISLGDEDMVSGRVRLEFDDSEAPSMLAYDRGLFCGGHECACDCSIGFPDFDNSLDVFCPVHGGTEVEQQAASEELCKQGGHWFPLKREGYCLTCRKVYYIPTGDIRV